MQHNLTDLSLAADNLRLASRHPTRGFPYRIMTAWNWVTAAERQSYICTRGLQQFRPYLAAIIKYVAKALYENMFKDLKDGCFMDCTKAAWAHAVKTKVPLEQRMFIHIGVVPAALFLSGTILQVLYFSFSIEL